jgi:hypothetical protein
MANINQNKKDSNQNMSAYLNMIAYLQRLAEKEIGNMPSHRGIKPTKELLFKFYHFYWEHVPQKMDNDNDNQLRIICSTKRKRIIKLADVHYGLDFENFNNEFHIWNKINNPKRAVE